MASGKTRRKRRQRQRKEARTFASAPIATLGDLPQVERAVSAASQGALDIQTPAFWRSLWSEE